MKESKILCLFGHHHHALKISDDSWDFHFCPDCCRIVRPKGKVEYSIVKRVRDVLYFHIIIDDGHRFTDLVIDLERRQVHAPSKESILEELSPGSFVSYIPLCAWQIIKEKLGET